MQVKDKSSMEQWKTKKQINDVEKLNEDGEEMRMLHLAFI